MSDDACHDKWDFEDIEPEGPSLAGDIGNRVVETLAEFFAEYGLPHTLEPGWTTRNPSYNWYQGAPHGVMVHHTATDGYSPERAYPQPEGTRDDGKTICNLLIQPDGTVNFVSSDPANYSSGLNWKGILCDHVKPRVRFYGPQSGPLGPEWYGNRAFVNIETVHPGDGSEMPDAQEQMVIITAGLLVSIIGTDSTGVIGHYDGRGTKVDPRWNFDDYRIAYIQDAVQALLDGNEIPAPPTPEPEPEPDPDPEDYDMPTLRYRDGFFDGSHPEYRSAVKACQIMLAHHDFADLGTVDGKCAADGAYGRGTESAVSNFQQHNGLEIDGICGPRTWAALNEERN